MPLFAAPSRLPHKTRVKGALIQKHQFWLAVLALPDAPIQNRRAKAAPAPRKRRFWMPGRGGFLQATLCGCRGNLKKLCAKNAFQGAMASCVNAPKQRALFSFTAKGRTETERVCTRFRLPCSARRHISPTLPMPVVRLSCKQGCKRAWARQLSLPGPVPPAGKI